MLLVIIRFIPVNWNRRLYILKRIKETPRKLMRKTIKFFKLFLMLSQVKLVLIIHSQWRFNRFTWKIFQKLKDKAFDRWLRSGLHSLSQSILPFYHLLFKIVAVNIHAIKTLKEIHYKKIVWIKVTFFHLQTDTTQWNRQLRRK